MINLLEKLDSENTMMKSLHVAMIIIGVVGIVLFVPIYQQGQINNLEIIYLAGFIFTEIMLFVIGSLFQSKQRNEEKRQKHAEVLIDKTFTHLTKLGMLHEVDNSLDIILPKLPKKEDEDEDDYEEKDVYLSDMPKPYIDWALQHLESYKEINKALENTYEFAKKHNELLNKSKEEIKNQIDAIFNEHFSNIKKYDDNNKRGYKSEKITDVLAHNMYMESWDLPEEDPNSNWIWKFTSEKVFDKYSNTYQIIGGYKDIYVVLENEEIDIDKLNSLMTSLGKNSDIQKKFDSVLLIYHECEKNLNYFRDELELLIQNLLNGESLKGKCKRC